MPDALLVASRLALYLSLALAFGLPVFVLQAIEGDGSGLPIVRRLARLTGVAALLALAASGLGLWAMARGMSESGDPAAVRDVAVLLLTQTSVGIAWDIRVVALLFAVGVAFLGFGRRPTGIGVQAMLGGVALATLAWAGHGAMSEGALGWLHLGSDIVHLWVAGAWVGAIVALIVLAFHAAGQEGPETVRLLSGAASGFARFGTVIVIVLVVSGVLNYLLIVGPSLDGLVHGLYGRLLLAKLGAFAGMLVLAAANRFRHAPVLQRALDDGDTSAAIRTLKQSLWAEMGLAVLVLVLVAWLGTLDPTG
ncbi:MAG TPA: copper homeostasis membrane protein CopD [Pseudoxanthomonas sp.]|nr:copper homeostasis membrane protein CopD [Pseudoxanthomonas sp.]